MVYGKLGIFIKRMVYKRLRRINEPSGNILSVFARYPALELETIFSQNISRSVENLLRAGNVDMELRLQQKKKNDSNKICLFKKKTLSKYNLRSF